MIPVEEAMIKNPEVVKEDAKIGAIANKIIFTGYQGFPVLNEKGELAGVLTQEDVRRGLKGGKHDATVAELETKRIIVTYPDEDLNEVLEKMALSGIGRLPVVSREDEKKLVGFITRSDIIKAHRKKVVEEGHAIPLMSSERQDS
ncbi:MAG: CBS domain-containing protein, partial [Thermoplasmata archaeon]